MYPEKDNRVFERITGELDVRYSPQGSEKEYCSTTKNIGGGGIKISLSKRLSPGTNLDIEIFKYDTDITAKCRGRIVWLSKEEEPFFQAGIQFINRKLLDIGRLMEYLERM